MRASAVHDGPKREMLESIIANTRQHIATQGKLVVQEPDTAHPHGLHAAVMETPVGQNHWQPEPERPIGVQVHLAIA